MNPIRQAYLAGYVNPIGLVPSFFEPVFVKVPNANEYLLQECDDNNKIVRFVPGVEDDEDVLRVEPTRRKRVGQSAIYAFCPGPSDKTILADERDSLANLLKPELPRYVDHPGLYLEMMEFCSVVEGLSEARSNAYQQLEKNVSPDAARAWRDTQIFLPPIQSLIRKKLLEVQQSNGRKGPLPFPLVKLNSRSSSILSVQAPATLKHVLMSRGRDGQSLIEASIRGALSDFGVKDIEVTFSRRYDELIEKHVGPWDENDDPPLKVVDTALALKIIEGGDDLISLEPNGIVKGYGELLARLRPSRNVLQPAIQIFADDTLPNELHGKLEARVSAWLNARIGRTLAPLLVSDKITSLTPQATRTWKALVNSVGVLERRKFATDIKKIEQEERSVLRALGVRFGTVHIYIPILLKPAARLLAGQLSAIRKGANNREVLSYLQELTSAGRTTIPIKQGMDPGLFRAFGFVPFSDHAIRVDILERIIDLIRAALSWSDASKESKPKSAVDGEHFFMSDQMTSTASLNATALARILPSLGYRKAGQMRQPVFVKPKDRAYDEREWQERNELWTFSRRSDLQNLLDGDVSRNSRGHTTRRR